MAAISMTPEQFIEVFPTFYLMRNDLIAEALNMVEVPPLETISCSKTWSEAVTEYCDCFDNESPKQMAAQRKIIELSVTEKDLLNSFQIFSRKAFRGTISELGCFLIIRKFAESLKTQIF